MQEPPIHRGIYGKLMWLDQESIDMKSLRLGTSPSRSSPSQKESTMPLFLPSSLK